MQRHVFLTGEIGAGKSTALAKTLALLGGIRVMGLQTYYEEPRGADGKTLYLRAWGDSAQGCFLTRIPGGEMSHAAQVFDERGCALLSGAQAGAELIVIDEIGRLERDAFAYHKALGACIDGDVPMLCAIRKHKAAWADWVKDHPAVMLLEVTPDNRDEVPRQAAALLAAQINRAKAKNRDTMGVLGNGTNA